MNDTVTIPRLMTVREVADALRCSRSQVYGLLYAGTIPATKIAGKTLCRAMDVEAYIRTCLQASGLEAFDVAAMKPSSGPEPAQHASASSDAVSAHRRNKRLMI
jgi:excisionase family DNA binding protein